MIFVDTWAWLALAHKRDPYHAAAVQAHHALLREKRLYVTTDYVLSETMAPLFGVLNFAKAEQFMLKVFQAVRTGAYQLELITSARFERAWQLRRRYHDKPDISFVDFTSMVVMQDLGIAEIFSGDSHFLQVGLGFQLTP